MFANLTISIRAGREAALECVSDEALSHLKSYKYSSVDNSLLTHYVLKHYVNPPGPNLLFM